MPPMQVDEGESLESKDDMFCSDSLYLFYGRIANLTQPLQVDESES